MTNEAPATSNAAGPPSAATAAVVAGLLIVSGVLLGLIGAFLVPLRLGSIEGLSIVVALLGNLVIGLLGGWGMRASSFAFLPGVGWFVSLCSVLLISRGGDVILPGSLADDPGVVHVGDGFMIAGLVGTALAVFVVTRFTRQAGTPKT